MTKGKKKKVISAKQKEAEKKLRAYKNRKKRVELILASEQIMSKNNVEFDSISNYLKPDELAAYVEGKLPSYKRLIDKFSRDLGFNKIKTQKNNVSIEDIAEACTEGNSIYIILFKIWSVANQNHYYETETINWYNKNPPDSTDIIELFSINAKLMKYKDFLEGVQITHIDLLTGESDTQSIGKIKKADKKYKIQKDIVDKLNKAKNK